MKFTFEVPAPLQQVAPISYYESLLSNYRYRDISFLEMSTTGKFLENVLSAKTTTPFRVLNVTD